MTDVERDEIRAIIREEIASNKLINAIATLSLRRKRFFGVIPSHSIKDFAGREVGLLKGTS